MGKCYLRFAYFYILVINRVVKIQKLEYYTP